MLRPSSLGWPHCCGRRKWRRRHRCARCWHSEEEEERVAPEGLFMCRLEENRAARNGLRPRSRRLCSTLAERVACGVIALTVSCEASTIGAICKFVHCLSWTLARLSPKERAKGRNPLASKRLARLKHLSGERTNELSWALSLLPSWRGRDARSLARRRFRPKCRCGTRWKRDERGDSTLQRLVFACSRRAAESSRHISPCSSVTLVVFTYWCSSLLNFIHPFTKTGSRAIICS